MTNDQPSCDEPIEEPAGADKVDPEHLEDLFAQALDLELGARPAFLERECSGRPLLRRELEELLEVSAASTKAWEELDAGGAAQLLHSVWQSEDGGTQIGPYRLVRELGRGGMGTVHLAERIAGGFEQRAALKLVRRDLDSEAMLENFQSERQILARLEHPGIARLLDGGVTDDGQPWFAMELVDGEPITVYCNRHEVGIEDRLRLFGSVCDAVQQAHTALIVHRDLKPSNVLVTEAGEVKLVDFGIAKELDPGLAGESSPMTQEGLRALTPEYASPEQVRGETVTTASDVYSLGVLLYELLTGRLPYDGPMGSPAQIVDQVCSSQPTAPSTAIEETPAGDLASADVRRLRGDLDAIALKALAKERDRRYHSADALAEDIQRHLDGLPIKARPPGLGYRTGKFVRRHRWLVLAASLAVVALLLGLVGTAWQATLARTERDRATDQASRAEAAVGFLSGILSSPQPTESGRQITVTELLEGAVEKIDTQLADQPRLQSRTLAIIGRTYLDLDRQVEAEPLLRRSLELRLRHYDSDHPAVLESRLLLARCLTETRQLEEAESLIGEVMASAEQLAPDHAVQVQGRVLQSRIAFDRDQLAEARRLLEEALDIRSDASWIDDPERRRAELDLARLLTREGDYAAAESLLHSLVEWNERIHGERHGSTLAARFSLAVTLDRQGRSTEAEELMRHNLAVAEDWLGEDDYFTIGAISNLSNNLADQGKVAQSAELSQRALALSERNFGPTHGTTLTLMANHASRLRDLGQVDAATDLMSETIRRVDEAFGPTHDAAMTTRYNLAELLHHEGRSTEALVIAREARGTIAETLGERHLYTLVTDAVIGGCLAAIGRWEEAEGILRRTLNLQREILGESHPFTLEAQVYLAQNLRESGETEEAVSLLHDALVRRQKVLGPDHPKTLEAQAELESWNG